VFFNYLYINKLQIYERHLATMVLRLACKRVFAKLL